MRNALLQAVNIGPCELYHGVIGSSHIQRGLQQLAPDQKRRLLPENVLPAIPVQPASKSGPRVFLSIVIQIFRRQPGMRLRIASVGLTAPSVRAPYGTLNRITARNMSGLKIAAL